MIKATVVNTLRLTMQMVTSRTDEALLEHLTKTVNRKKPATAKYADAFDLDGLTPHLVKEYEETPHSSLNTHSVASQNR
jgi:hypothetical protein